MRYLHPMGEIQARKVRWWNKEYGKVVSLMKTAFPPAELVPMFLLRLLALRRGASFLSFHDKEKFVGVAYIVRYHGESFLFYLAVSEKERGKGYGSKILTWIKAHTTGSIILDVEALDPQKENYQERVRRVAFYARNGITDTHWSLYDSGIKYMVLSSNPKAFNPDTLVKCWRSYCFGLYDEKPFKE